jgi:hypothetical protein
VRGLERPPVAGVGLPAPTAKGDALMTYQNDPNLNRPFTNPNPPEPTRPTYPITRDTNYTPWIIAGLAAVALLVGLFTMFGRDSTTKTANNPKPISTTTGLGPSVPVPAPGSGNGTAGNPSEPVPAPTRR